MKRPFQEIAGIACRGYSLLLQRAITDFGADVPFGRVPDKLREHYGIELGTRTAAVITEQHAHAIDGETMIPPARKTAEALTLVAEMDGSMIPTVETGPVPGEEGGAIPNDLRKTRRLLWKEAKLTLVRRSDEVKPLFAATLGDASAAGAQLRQLAEAAGMNRSSHVHGLGDGACWIAEKMEEQFGTQARYTVDFYHVCEYLNAASGSIVGEEQTAWMDKQKTRLKTGQLKAVMAALEPHREPANIASEDAPVRACYRYFEHRPGQFEYQDAIARDLPIGSGEIESAHRYMIQERIKRPGAWWKKANAQAMLNLRVARANGCWDNYWDRLFLKAA